MSLFIYDRLREKVFETHDINTGWDGTYKGKILNTAIFLYCLDYTNTLSDTLTEKKGNNFFSQVISPFVSSS